MEQSLIVKLEEKRLNLSHWFIIEEVIKGKNISDAVKETSIWQTLVRKNLVTDFGITDEGKELYDSIKLSKKISPKIRNIRNGPEMFEEWWAAYPATDRIVDEFGNILFKETRALKVGKKEKVKEKYIEILNEGVYSHDALLAALRYEVKLRVKQSIEKGENMLKFMKGSSSYLNQEGFVPFIELAKLPDSESTSDTIII